MQHHCKLNKHNTSQLFYGKVRIKFVNVKLLFFHTINSTINFTVTTKMKCEISEHIISINKLWNGKDSNICSTSCCGSLFPLVSLFDYP